MRFKGNAYFVPVLAELWHSQLFEFVVLGLAIILPFNQEQSHCVAVATDAGLLPQFQIRRVCPGRWMGFDDVSETKVAVRYGPERTRGWRDGAARFRLIQGKSAPL